MLGKVPMWFWKLKSRQYGARLPKRTVRAPKTWEPERGTRFPLLRGGAIIEPEFMRARKPGTLNGFRGNLEPEEYQFWVGSESRQASYRKCRACGESVYNEADVKKHHRTVPKGHDISCAKQCQIICSYLMRDKVCIICSASTGNTKWGVPVCDTEKCLKKFMFSHIPDKDSMWEKAKEVATKHGWASAKRSKRK